MTHWMEGDWPENCEVESEQDKMLKNVCSLIRKLSSMLPAMTQEIDEAVGELENAADEIETMFESNDPRSMGWVGDDGLP